MQKVGMLLECCASMPQVGRVEDDVYYGLLRSDWSKRGAEGDGRP